jgi:hypothetical protein
VHGIVALGLEEKLVSLPMPELRTQLAMTVRAIVAGRAELRSAAHTSPGMTRIAARLLSSHPGGCATGRLYRRYGGAVPESSEFSPRWPCCGMTAR